MIDIIGLIDSVIGVPTQEQAVRAREEQRDWDLRFMGLEPWFMGGIATKGCGRCGGTMWRTEEPGGGGQWVCGNPSCGAVE